MTTPWFKLGTVPWTSLTKDRNPQDGEALLYDAATGTFRFGTAGQDITIPNILAALPTGAGDGQVIKYDLTNDTLVWADDQVGSPGSGEANVQVDWNVTDTASDAFILNKPDLSTKADTDLQNIADNLTETQKTVVLDRIGAEADPYDPTVVYKLGRLTFHDGDVWIKTAESAAGVAPAFAQNNPWNDLTATDHYRGLALDVATWYSAGDIVRHNHEAFLSILGREATAAEIPTLADQGAFFLRLGAFSTAHIFTIDGSDVTYPSTHVVNLAATHGEAESINDIYIFQWSGDPTAGSSTQDIFIRVNMSSGRAVLVRDGSTLRNMRLGDLVQNGVYVVEKTSATQYHLIGGTTDHAVPAAQVQPDWNATTGLGSILNKPTIRDTILDLTDTPTAYAAVGTVLAVNASRSGFNFVAQPDISGFLTQDQVDARVLGLISTFAHEGETALVPPVKLGTGTPVATDVLYGDGAWRPAPTGGMGSATFLGLSDTPGAFGTAGQILQVNSATNALEWTNKPAGMGASTFLGLSDTPTGYPPAGGGSIVHLNAPGNALVFSKRLSRDQLAAGGSGGQALFQDAMGNLEWAAPSGLNAMEVADAINARIDDILFTGQFSGNNYDLRIADATSGLDQTVTITPSVTAELLKRVSPLLNPYGADRILIGGASQPGWEPLSAALPSLTGFNTGTAIVKDGAAARWGDPVDPRFVFPGVTGVLRAPTAADWSTAFAYSRVAGFTGHLWQRVKRTLIAAHTATVTWSADTPDGTYLGTGSVGSTTNLRYRRLHHSDSQVTSPEHYDLYYNFGSGWKVYDGTGANLTWQGIADGHPYLLASRIVGGGLHASEVGALAALTQQGQRALYTIPGSPDTHVLATADMFTPAAPQHYQYDWEDLPGGTMGPGIEDISDLKYVVVPAQGSEPRKAVVGIDIDYLSGLDVVKTLGTWPYFLQEGDVDPAALTGNTNVWPVNKLPGFVTGWNATNPIAYNTTTRTLILSLLGSNNQPIVATSGALPSWATLSDIADEAEFGNTNPWPVNKVPNAVSGFSAGLPFTYNATSRKLRLSFQRLTGADVAAESVELPDWTTDAEIENFAKVAQPHVRIEPEKLAANPAGAHYLRMNTAGTGTEWGTLPAGSTPYPGDAYVQNLARGMIADWAEFDNTDDAPVGKIPDLNAVKITAGVFSPQRLGNGTPSAVTVLYGNEMWGVPTIPSLGDTPSGYGTSGQLLAVNSTGNGLEWVTPQPPGMGSSTWLGLTDTPGAYGTEGQVPAVNAARTALGFVDLPTQDFRWTGTVAYTQNASGFWINLSDGTTNAPVRGRAYSFQFQGTIPTTLATTLPVRVNFNGQVGTAQQPVIIYDQNAAARRNMTLGELVRLNYYTIQWQGSASGAWHLIAQTVHATTSQNVAGLVEQWAQVAHPTTVIPIPKIPNLDAGKITSGVFGAAMIPDLPFSKITGNPTAAQLASGGTTGQFLQRSGGVVRWATPTGTGMGSSTWLGLSDTPGTFGTAGDLVRINAAADGLEFTSGLDASVITSGIIVLPRLPPAIASTVVALTFEGRNLHVVDLDGSTADLEVPMTALGTGTPSATTFLRGDATWVAGSGSFLGLSDTPSSWGNAGQIAQINTAGDGLEWVNKPAGMGTSTFAGLTDTPNTITANAFVRGNASGSALVFDAIPASFHRLLPSGDLGYPNQHTVNIANQSDIAGGDVIVFQYNPGADLTPSAERLQVGITGSSNSRWQPGGDRVFVKILTGSTLRDMVLNDLVRYNLYYLYRAGAFWHFVAGTQHVPPAAWAMNTDASGTAPTARLGTGTATSSDVLLGNSTWGNIGTAIAPFVEDYAEVNNSTATIPQSRFAAGGTSGQVPSISGTGWTWVTPGTGGMGLTAEQVRDTINAQDRAGAGIVIDVEDALDTRTFSIDQHYETVPSLVLLQSDRAYFLNRDRTDEAFEIATGLPSAFLGACWHQNRAYAVHVGGEIRRSAVSALTGWTSIGTLPTGRGDWQSLASDGTHIYAASNNGLTRVDLANPGSSTSLGSWPSTFVGPGGMDFDTQGTLVITSASRREVWTLASPYNPLNMVDQGDFPNTMNGLPYTLSNVSGRFYTVESHSNGSALWRVNVSSPGNTVLLGQLPSSFTGSTAASLAADLPLSTTLIPEGRNLYWTNDRFDTRFDSRSPIIDVDVGSAIPAPTSSNEEKLVLAGAGSSRNLYHQHIQSATGLSVTYATFDTTRLRLLTTNQENYQGTVANQAAVQTMIDAGTTSDGDTWYSSADREFLRIVSGVLEAYTPGELIRENYATKDEADRSVRSSSRNVAMDAIGTLVAYGTAHAETVYQVTAYTPSSGETRKWVLLDWDVRQALASITTSSGGLSQSEVDARIAIPARIGNTSVWGTGKLGTGTAGTNNFLRGDGAWANSIIGSGNSTVLTLGGQFATTHPALSIQSRGTSTTNPIALEATRFGQTHEYFQVSAGMGGSAAQSGIALGGGTATPDAILYRESAGTFRTDQNVKVGDLQFINNAARDKVRSNLGLATVSWTGDYDDLTNTPTLADAAPPDIASAAAIGTATDVAREDHTHELPIDNTLYWDSSDQLAVQISEVIEHLQENIQYWTSSTNFNTNGSTSCEVFTTGPHTTTVSKITVEQDPPAGSQNFRARIYRVDSNDTIQEKLGQSGQVNIGAGSAGTFTYRFDGLGVSIPKNSRIAIGVSRIGEGDNADTLVRSGSEHSNSPNQSYTDADKDFDFVHSVEYASPDPGVNTGRKWQGNVVHGSIRIYYDLKYEHAAFLGDDQVNAAHIDSESATDGQVLTADGSGNSAWEDVPDPDLPIRVYTSGVTYGGTANSIVEIADAGYTPGTGDIVVFQHNTENNANYSASNNVRLDVAGEGPVNVIFNKDGAGGLDQLLMSDVSRYEWLGCMKAGSNWHLIFRTLQGVEGRIASWARANSPSGSAPIARGGTGATSASGARTNLGLGALATRDDVQDSHIDSESATDGQVLTADGSGNAAWESPQLEFSQDVNSNLNLRSNQFIGTGFTGWANKKVIFWSPGRISTTNMSHDFSPGFIMFVGTLSGLTPTTAGTNRNTLTENTHYIQVEFQSPFNPSAVIVWWFARTSSNELLIQAFQESEDAYPFRAIAL